MLKGIPRVLSPELLMVLAQMGHGDEIAIVDGNYPAESSGPPVIRADGHGVPEIMRGILSLLPLDTFASENVFFMDNGKEEKPPIWEEFLDAIKEAEEEGRIKALGRFEFYDRAKNAFCIVATGETALYANVILKKGVIFPV